ncbi:hypothetical protein GCM10025868_28430 [Angustibacter aerolatus]|uniref:Uncharacterized protein n=1 Tax=Angustibacter aerolatus TaxID=1162965 RepID=A0ABQ6JHC0_9ACTN|nr:hypothetical protein [Angustibacter aerolatus]GMA87593.1 hypothetical protein GCM10025868_28430 [Angustibacter aerolatus]
MRRAWRGAVAAAAVLALGGSALAVAQPTLRAARDASDLEPGLLQVDDVARGAVSLGNGVYAQIGSGGLVVNRRARVVWRGVDRGSPVTAAVGRLRWRGGVGDEVLQADEQVDRSLGNVRLTGRRLEANAVVYTGRISDGDPLAAGALPLTLTVTRRVQDSRVVLTADVPGASAVAWHEYRRAGYAYRGLGAQPSAAVLRDGRYPLVPRRPVAGDGWVDRLNARTDGSGAVTLAPVRFWLGSDGTGVGVDGSAHAVVDLRHAGRVDTTVWDETARLRVYDGRPTQVLAQHASDLPPVTPPPTWATSGALVGVHGSPDVVRRSVQRLLDADAVVAAAVVPDGGATARYPGWTRLVERLRDRDVRVVASVSPAFALRPRPGGPADEQRLLATARRQGWLVRTAAGEARVPVADVDRGTVPGALLDLTDPDAVEWYAGQAAGRLRAERLSGWVVEGGAERRPTPGWRTARGRPSAGAGRRAGPVWCATPATGPAPTASPCRRRPTRPRRRRRGRCRWTCPTCPRWWRPPRTPASRAPRSCTRRCPVRSTTTSRRAGRRRRRGARCCARTRRSGRSTGRPRGSRRWPAAAGSWRLARPTGAACCATPWPPASPSCGR